jgi:hypothetical protein
METFLCDAVLHGVMTTTREAAINEATRQIKATGFAGGILS